MRQGIFRSWVEINKSALVYNFGTFREFTHKLLLMAVVKSNAYGHGLVECAKLFVKSGCDWLGVDDIDEAIALRKAEIKKPILVFGYTLPSRYREASSAEVSLTIGSLDALREIKKQSLRDKVTFTKSKLRIHLKLDTGLNRQGISEELLAASCQVLEKLKDVILLEGVYSHFAAAELVRRKHYRDYCNKQMDGFERMYNLVLSSLVPNTYNLVPIRHMAGTAATFLLPRSRYDLVRVGIGLYGMDPTSKSNLPFVKKLKLKPVLSWHSLIAQVKNVKKDEYVGYNLTEKLIRNSKLAVVPVGYWHGYPRSASSRGEVIVSGKRCKVIGRISMDMMTIDVTDVPKVKAGDKVVLIGKQDKENLSAEEVAVKAETINYELVTSINPLLPRCYI